MSEATIEAYQDEQAALWDTIAFCCTTIGQAIRDRDAIAGTLASEGLLENLKHLSPELKEMLTVTLAEVPHGR
jgi:hypothetical protein